MQAMHWLSFITLIDAIIHFRLAYLNYSKILKGRSKMARAWQLLKETKIAFIEIFILCFRLKIQVRRNELRKMRYYLIGSVRIFQWVYTP